MKKHMVILPVFLVAMVALVMGATVTEGWAQEPSVCFFNIEFNATDLDVGVRGFFDYEPWNLLTIDDPDAVEIARVTASAGLFIQGYAEWFFESGEPELEIDTYYFSDLFERFPDSNGDYYVFTATPNAGDPEVCNAELTYVIPCAPEISAAGNRGLGVTISWDEVTQVVDTGTTDDNIAEEVEEPLVCEDSVDLEIVGYEVIVETEDEEIFKIDLPEDARSVTVPPAFIEEGAEYQYEVLAIEDSGNQTITEECFAVSEQNGHVVECPEDNGD